MEAHNFDIETLSKKRRVDSSIIGNLPNPKVEGSSKVVQFADNVVYRLYFKGLVSNEAVVEGDERTVTAGFGVAICDEADNLLYEMKESLSDVGIKRKEVAFRALVHGLSESLVLGIKNVMIYCDDYPIYQYITGSRMPKKNKIVLLVAEVQSLREKMTSSEFIMVTRNDVKFAFKLAKEATVSQLAKEGETCVICLEETDAERMFVTNKSLHRHCFSCVRQYVEVKLLGGIAPTCLGDGCKIELTLESCSKILSVRVIDMWKQKMKEDLIPVAERIYCPYQSCSMLMSKTELLRSADEVEQSNVRECVKCSGFFCIECKVPSHTDLSCAEYKKLHPDPLVDDMKLKSLANDNRWRQCVKCRHLIELSQGCNHMTCRCGYEFCYKCGIEWKKDQKSCPSGCLSIEAEDEDDDDDDSEHTCEEDMCTCYYDDDGGRWRDFEDFIDHQPPVPYYVELELNESLQNRPRYVLDDRHDYDEDYNYGGLTESDDEGGFNEGFFRDYYSL
ncbi:hypothetical protein AALP_AA6G261900 [Arabis alpina]|uniref:RBR-type E3 ubiquitin transferase n=1 Tax=Arabis alpina TaxID=50452 RepID=A0A087GRS9_ARAAL|nr:hypothetical protein AALP_AA6G261900 [Arabis alpina]